MLTSVLLPRLTLLDNPLKMPPQKKCLAAYDARFRLKVLLQNLVATELLPPTLTLVTNLCTIEETEGQTCVCFEVCQMNTRCWSSRERQRARCIPHHMSKRSEERRNSYHMYQLPHVAGTGKKEGARSRFQCFRWMVQVLQETTLAVNMVNQI